MYFLPVLVLIVSLSGGNAEVIGTSQIIKHVIGGSQITFNLDGLEIGDVNQLKCVVRFHDGRDSIETKASIPRNNLNAICRLPSAISATIVDVDLAITTLTRSASTTETHTVSPSAGRGLEVVENWNANQLALTWNSKYFEQFFVAGQIHVLQLVARVAKSFDPDDESFTEIEGLLVQNLGTATVYVPALIATLSNVLYPYYYVLKPTGSSSLSDFFLTSPLFTPTLPTDNVISTKTLFLDPSEEDELKVKEDWNANQLTLTWNSTYFEQYFDAGKTFTLQLVARVAKSFDPVDEGFTEIVVLLVQNLGTTTVTVPAQNVAKLSNVLYPYYYVLSPTGSSNVFLTSLLFAPTLGMDQDAAQRTCLSWLDFATVPSPPEEIHPCPPCLCQMKFDTNFIQSEYPPQLVELANGALNDHVLYYEAVPTQSGYSQTCLYNNLTKNLATNSPAQSGFINYFSKISRYGSEYNFFYDIWPYMVCCLQTNSQEYCDLFHEKRPIDTGHAYEGADSPCYGSGDPHMDTFESVKYDFMGYGEFWLIRGPEGNEFGVQGRMSPWPNELASYYKAVAARDGNITVQVELREGNLTVIVNGKELRFSKLPVSLPMESIFLVINSTHVDIRFQSGFSILVENVRNVYVNVYGRAAQYNKGKGFMGIFGNYDDNPDNDLTSRDGFIIPPTVDNIRDLSLIHHRFGLTWLVNRTESFFVYEDGKSWDDHVNIEFGPISKYPDPATLPEEVRLACGDSLFCYYEYVGTGDLEQALETAKKETELDEMRKEMEEKIPMCDTLSRPANGRVQVNGYLNGSSATYSCNSEYDFESGDRVRTCSASKDNTQWTGVEPVCLWTCTPCLESTEFEVSHDPSDCSKMFICYFGERMSSYCTIGTLFDPKTLECTNTYKCPDVPGC